MTPFQHKPQELAILGLGFMGASLAAAWKRFGLGPVRAYDPVSARCSWALSAGIVRRGYSSVAEAVQGADIVACAAPVNHIVGSLLEAARHASAGAILTDLGSARTQIDAALKEKLPAGVAHAGSHPLAGSEKTGPEQCSDILFVGKLVLLTQVSASAAQMALLRELWERLGARTESIDSVEHDRILAETSHLPHLVAFALAKSLPAAWRPFAATGFKDTTRIAGGSPEIWGPIFHSNRAMLLVALDRFQNELTDWRRKIDAGDCQALHEIIVEANRARKELG